MSIPFDVRVDAISEYLGISKEAALYIYLRKKRSWKKHNDHKYLRWSIQLQNALVKADKCIGFDWQKLQFGEEETELIKHGITIGVKREEPILGERKSEWVSGGGVLAQHKKTLQIMGFIRCKNPKKILERTTKKRNTGKKNTGKKPLKVIEKLETSNLFDILED